MQRIFFLSILVAAVFSGQSAVAGVFLAPQTTRIEGAVFGASGPQGIAYHPIRGTLFVADRSNQVFEIDLNGNFQQSFSTAGFMPGTPSTVDIVYDPITGNLLLADEGRCSRSRRTGTMRRCFSILTER